MNKEVSCEVRGRMGLVTLNRPRALNALSLGMVTFGTMMMYADVMLPAAHAPVTAPMQSYAPSAAGSKKTPVASDREPTRVGSTASPAAATNTVPQAGK